MLTHNDLEVHKFKSPTDCKDFRCEKEEYASFLKNEDEALKLQVGKTSVTWLFKYKGQVIGYVTLAMGSLPRKLLPESEKDSHRFPKIPCLLLGQMARHRDYYGQMIGTIMNDWVFQKANGLAREVGCRFVIVDAEKDKVDHYVRYYGYTVVPDDEADEDRKTKTMYFDLRDEEPTETGEEGIPGSSENPDKR